MVPLPLLTSEAGGIPELAADTLVALLRHRYRDLGPRSSDILASSLYALGRTPEPAFIDLLRLWSDTAFRAWVTSLVQDDPVLMSFFGWFNGLNPAERAFVLAAPMNKIRPLLQRASVRNVLGAPRATFTMAQALKEKLIVIVILPEGVLGKDATTLIGQVVLARLWAAVQARSGPGVLPGDHRRSAALSRPADRPGRGAGPVARVRRGHDPDRAIAAAVPGELARGGAQQRPDEDRVRHVGH